MESRNLDDYKVLTTVGTGSYATCKKVQRKSDGKIFVWKEIYYGSMGDSEKQMLVSEVNLLRELKHPNIVRYYDRIIDRSKAVIYIVMEYCPGGDLASHISKCKKDGTYTDEEFTWKVMSQIVNALNECHRRKNGKPVLHRDLKPANVFLNASMDVKVGDFGLARVLQHETSFASTFVGTPYYMSPELVNNKSYNEKSDVWSLGCMLYELCALIPPFTGANQAELNRKIRCGTYPRIPLRYSSELNQIIGDMLQVEVSRRPTMKDILAHQSFRQHNAALERPQGGTPLDDLLQQCRNGPVVNGKDKDGADTRERRVTEALERLKSREKSLDVREKEIKSREANLAMREKLAERKLERAEGKPSCPRCQGNKDTPRDGSRTPELGHRLAPNIADEPVETPTTQTIMQNSSPLPDTPKRRVSFEARMAKENHLLKDSDNVRPTPRDMTDITNVDARSSQGDKLEAELVTRELIRRKELQDRLFKAKMRMMDMRAAEVKARTSAKHLLYFR